jgi:hypothetical protein
LLGFRHGTAFPIQAFNEEGVLASGQAFQHRRWGFGGLEHLPVQVQAKALLRG